jgi:hypothetical protein
MVNVLYLNYLICFCHSNYESVESVRASYFMCEGMQLTFRVNNDNLDLDSTTNGNRALQYLIFYDREPYDTGIGDV